MSSTIRPLTAETVLRTKPRLEDQEIVWAPQAGSQAAFLSVPQEVFEVLYEGTRGPGKTDALLMDFAQHIGQGYGAAWRGVLFRRTYKELGDVIAKSEKWFPRIWPDAKFNKAGSVWEFPSGERLLFRHFKSVEDYNLYHGHEYPWIAWEELTNWPDDRGYKKMMSLCRSSTPGMPRKYRATTNPHGPGHNWVKMRWRLKGIPKKGPGPIIRDSYDEDGQLEEPRVSIHGTLHENRILLEADPKYIDKLRMSASSPAELRAWLYGDWDIVAGGMFDDVWDYKTHVLPPFTPPKGWRVFRSFDWGSARPFSVGWWCESDGSDLVLERKMPTVRGDLFRFMEWYGWTGKPNQGSRLLPDEIARGIVERELAAGIHGRVTPGPADSSIFNTEHNGESIAMVMQRPVRVDDQRYSGVVWTRADKSPGSRVNGWEVMRKRLKGAKAMRRDGLSLPRETPGLFVTERCEDFIRTVPVLPRNKRNPDDVDSEAEDHIADETRYAVRSAGSKTTQSKVIGMY